MGFVKMGVFSEDCALYPNMNVLTISYSDYVYFNPLLFFLAVMPPSD